jgi:hypothetical protein
MRNLPLDARGYPVPYVVECDISGKPLFIVNSAERNAICIHRKLCPICGERLTKELWYVGGPQSALHPQGCYLDSAMHHECMAYALQVCPYLAMSRSAARDAVIDKLQTRLPEVKLLVDPTIDMRTPVVFMAVMSYGRSLSYHLSKDQRNPYQKPLRPYHAVEFWHGGQRLDFEEGCALIRDQHDLDLSALRLVIRHRLDLGVTNLKPDGFIKP